jgi:hypothetical protein
MAERDEPDVPLHPRPQGPRLQLFLLCLMVAGVLAYYWAWQGQLPLPMLLLAGACFLIPLTLVGRPWVVGPFSVRWSYRLKARPEFQPFEPIDPDTPRDVAVSVRRTARRLAPLGFTPWGHLRYASDAPRSTMYLTLFVNPAERVVARLVTLYVGGQTATPWGTSLGFWTEFADGAELVTSNAQTPPPFPPRPGRTGAVLPQVRDAGRLYKIHAELVRRSANMTDRRPPPDGDPAAYQLAVTAREMSDNAAAGYLYFDEAGEVYRLTWRGAFRLVWGQAWPVGAIRRFLRTRRAAALLRDIEGEDED